MKENIVMIKAFSFAIEIVNLCKIQVQEKKEYILSKQVLRSGTAIGALIRESEHAESKSDFIHKMQVSLKEANETEYWLELLKDSGYLQYEVYASVQNKCREIISILVKIIKTSKENRLASKI